MDSNSLCFKSIVLATELGDSYSAAFEYAQEIARVCQSRLVLAHVIDPITYAFPDSEPAFIAANPRAHQELRRFEHEAEVHGITVHSPVQSETIRERILQSVADHKADLLILGTRGETEAGRVALGTIARLLAPHLSCPVLTIPPGARPSLSRTGYWRRVLAATDFSPSSIAGLHIAQMMVIRSLITLHVTAMEHRGHYPAYRKWLRFYAPFGEPKMVPVEHLVMSGDPAELIIENARRYGADLVVLGSPAADARPDSIAASTILRVITKLPCAVMCVPLQPAQKSAEETYGMAVVG